MASKPTRVVEATSDNRSERWAVHVTRHKGRKLWENTRTCPKRPINQNSSPRKRAFANKICNTTRLKNNIPNLWFDFRVIVFSTASAHVYHMCNSGAQKLQGAALAVSKLFADFINYCISRSRKVWACY